MRSAWFFLAMAIIVVVAVFLLLRSGKLREKYAALWVVVGLAVIILAVFPGLLEWVTDLVGVEVPANFLFAMSLLFLLAVALHLSLEVSRAEEQIRTLAEQVAMLNRAQESAPPPSPHPSPPQHAGAPELPWPQRDSSPTPPAHVLDPPRTLDPAHALEQRPPDDPRGQLS